MHGQIKTFFSVRASQDFGGMADFFKRGHILNERGISRCLKIYYQSFQIVSFRTICANLHQMHVAAADDGNCCCSIIIIDCNYLAKFCCFPILLSICFHHFIPLSDITSII